MSKYNNAVAHLSKASAIAAISGITDSHNHSKPIKSGALAILCNYGPTSENNQEAESCHLVYILENCVHSVNRVVVDENGKVVLTKFSMSVVQGKLSYEQIAARFAEPGFCRLELSNITPFKTAA